MTLFKRLSLSLLALAALTGFSADGASASELLFTGQNAALFPQANPADTAALMNSVHKPSPDTSSSTAVSASRLIQQSLESRISSKIYNDIFDSAEASGFYDLGNGSTISYVRAGGNITITINDPANGSTVITVPDV
jgi:hypothetical protein